MASLCFAYYCSGHGYGHATRVSALACHLLKLENPTVRIHIVSSAPPHVFADSIAIGALYRFADIDPVIVQPLAYHVDRKKSIETLNNFLSEKQAKLEIERKWLVDVNAHCVLSDAAFLGCLAAKAAGLPSILITNFTFDSVYSYLSAPAVDTVSMLNELFPATPNSDIFGHLLSDVPIPLSDLAPLVEEIRAGYQCADLLMLLPGCIPIPSFFVSPSLPSQDWVDRQTHRFRPEVISHLIQSSPFIPDDLHPAIPFSTSSTEPRRHKARAVARAPLLVRQPAAEPSVYTFDGRTRFLSSIGVPPEFHDSHRTRILVVSFGGQVFRRPSSRPPSRPASRSGGQVRSENTSRECSLEREGSKNTHAEEESLPVISLTLRTGNDISPNWTRTVEGLQTMTIHDPPANDTVLNNFNLTIPSSPRLATSSHLWIPGAPPVSRMPSLPLSPQETGCPTFSMTLSTPTPSIEQDDSFFPSLADENEAEEPRLLPDASWIAIVCGVSKEQWNEFESDTELPSGFFVAPRYVYMPDLMAVADVLLGKLGYGTVSECIDSCSPFVYVSRPLFIEEYGLGLLLEREGVGVELSRQSYEEGDWAGAVQEAWTKGKEAKWRKRSEGAAGVGLTKREEDGVQLARKVVDWAEEWWACQSLPLLV